MQCSTCIAFKKTIELGTYENYERQNYYAYITTWGPGDHTICYSHVLYSNVHSIANLHCSTLFARPFSNILKSTNIKLELQIFFLHLNILIHPITFKLTLSAASIELAEY